MRWPPSKKSFTSAVDYSGKVCFWFFISYLVVALLVEAVFSFSRPKVADVSFLYYLAWLIDEQNIKPYLQLYDTSFPGTFIFHIVTAKLFGYSDSAYHYADTFFMSILLFATWLLLVPLHTRAAAAAVVAFGLYYFVGANTTMHFQRDYIGIIPVVMSLVLAQRWRGHKGLCFLGIGFLFSLSASIKPHFAIGLPAVISYAVFLWTANGKISAWYKWLQAGIWSLAGVLLWILFCGLWLAKQNALSAFFSMTTQYLPVYMNMDSAQTATPDGSYRWAFLLAIIGDAKFRWLAAGAACIWALTGTSSKRQESALALTLLTLCILYTLYVFIGGKGWDYHWMPFIYFQIVCSSLLLIPAKEAQRSWKGRMAMCVLAGLFFYSIKSFYSINITPTDTHQKLVRVQNEFQRFPYEEAAAVELVEYLKTRTRPGDKIGFRKDGTYGPLFPALLKLELIPATSFPLQTLLYRATDKPYIQGLRQQLLQESAELTNFFLDDAQFASEGKDSFPEFEQHIRENYVFKYDNINTHQIPYYFTVYERKAK